MKNEAARHSPKLTGVPETMLLTLFDRASESQRTDSKFKDPEAVRIFNSIDYNFSENFGRSNGGVASRAKMFDKIMSDWISRHPTGLVVNLAEGLETQNYRLDNGTIRWLSIDLPESIATREKFINPSLRFRHLAQNSLDFSWMDNLVNEKELFISAQGLLMYLKESQVKDLLSKIAQRLPQAEVLFDFVTHWIARKSLEDSGIKMTRNYKIPVMPWGTYHHEIEKTLRNWIPNILEVKTFHFDFFAHGFLHIIYKVAEAIPSISKRLPGIAHVSFLKN